MIVIPVKFTSVVIQKYARDSITIRINFTDGSKEKFIDKDLNSDFNTEELTEQIISEVRKIAKENNAKTGTNFLDDIVMVRFEHDEEELPERLNNALRRVKEEIRRTTGAKTSTNYLQNIANIQGAKFQI